MLLQSCPRKYYLRKLTARAERSEHLDSEIHLVFGKTVHIGIQLAFSGISQQEIVLAMFKEWNLALDAEHSKAKKSFYLAMIAVQKFIAMRETGYLEDLELVAMEKSFSIDYGDGFRDRGLIDIILRHKITGEIYVVEIKTDGSKYIPDPAKYANSDQALGYSVILDQMDIHCSSYHVLYLIYLTEKMEYETFPFTKTSLLKAQWVTGVKLDITAIRSYSSAGYWPKHGQSCMSYNRRCDFYDVCHLSNESIVPVLSAEEIEEIIAKDMGKFDYNISVEDLIGTQINRITSAIGAKPGEQ